jgi:hypothetical protein
VTQSFTTVQERQHIVRLLSSNLHHYRKTKLQVSFMTIPYRPTCVETIGNRGLSTVSPRVHTKVVSELQTIGRPVPRQATRRKSRTWATTDRVQTAGTNRAYNFRRQVGAASRKKKQIAQIRNRPASSPRSQRRKRVAM